jgi:hypothetical protein
MGPDEHQMRKVQMHSALRNGRAGAPVLTGLSRALAYGDAALTQPVGAYLKHNHSSYLVSILVSVSANSLLPYLADSALALEPPTRTSVCPKLFASNLALLQG